MSEHEVNEEILLGDFLAKVRKAKGLSQEQIAKRLCVEESLIKMIDANQFHEIKQSLVFVRGHIRSYAKMLSIPENKIISLLDAHGIAPKPTNVAEMDEVKPQLSVKSSTFRYMTWGIIVLLVLLIGIWWRSQITNKPVVQEAPPAVTISEPSAEEGAPEPPPVVEEKPVEAPKPVAPTKPVVPTAPAKPPVNQHKDVTNQLTMDYN